MAIGSRLTLCSVLLSGFACTSGDLPALGSNFGKLPVRISGEIQYSAIHPDDLISSRWNFRLSFIPVIPTFML
jgi:hypothetical protein